MKTLSIYLSIVVLFATPITSSAKVLDGLCNLLFGKNPAPIEVASVSPQSWPSHFVVSRYGVSPIHYKVDSRWGQRDLGLIEELNGLEFHTLHGYSVAFINKYCKVYKNEPTRCIVVRNADGKLLAFIIKAQGYDDSWFILHIAVNMDDVGKEVLSAMKQSDDFRGLRIATELLYVTGSSKSNKQPQERFIKLLEEIGYKIESFVPWRTLVAKP